MQGRVHSGGPEDTAGEAVAVAAKGVSIVKRVGANEPCPCGSGVKYKRCCRDEDEAAARGDRTAYPTNAPHDWTKKTDGGRILVPAAVEKLYDRRFAGLSAGWGKHGTWAAWDRVAEAPRAGAHGHDGG